MPIYVAKDSVEVWTMPELFKMDDDLQPLSVAGCPPDEFSDEGQLWGNPIYDWKKHRETGFAWWIYRIQESFKIYDILRIDHFKGFSDYWEIKGNSKTAKMAAGIQDLVLLSLGLFKMFWVICQLLQRIWVT